MTLRTCPRQPETLDLLACGQWPQACPPDLRAHLAGCRACAELVLVTHAFQQSRAASAAQAKLPAPGAIWWRAQLRRRNAAVERVGKPIFGAYVFALAITVFVAVALAIGQARHVFRWLDWLGQPQWNATHWQGLNASIALNSGWSLTILIPVLATVAVLGGVAVYLAADRK